MNHVAVVTGAGSGMGACVADRFLAEGWQVIALDIAPLPDSADLLAKAVDVRDRAAVAAALDDAVAHLGPPSVCVNAAGIYPPSTLADFTEAQYRAIFDINVLGTLNVAAETTARMPDGGSVVNFASVDAFANSPGQLLYCASKAAVLAVTRSLAEELAPRRIRVNTVAPGWVNTPGNAATGRMTEAAKGIPLGRVAEPEEIADMVWLLSGEGRAGYMTGETVVLSGGDVMR
jgi:NAD(P)-dependent dehydrogenase (short-subunit alcohol dehydrogenase family)